MTLIYISFPTHTNTRVIELEQFSWVIRKQFARRKHTSNYRITRFPLVGRLILSFRVEAHYRMRTLYMLISWLGANDSGFLSICYVTTSFVRKQKRFSARETEREREIIQSMIVIEKQIYRETRIYIYTYIRNREARSSMFNFASVYGACVTMSMSL